MQKILLINASMQNAACIDILENIQKNFWLDYSTEIVSIRDYDIEECKGCMYCYHHPGCVIEDKFKILKDKLIDSDIIVICTPCYFYNVPGVLKNFIDRTRECLPTKALANKKIVYIYCAHDNADTVKAYLDNATHGFDYCHHLTNLGSYVVQISDTLDVLDKDEENMIILAVSRLINNNL